MTATVNELRGHGDELLMVAMKDAPHVKGKVYENSIASEQRAHEALGHGDPLFQEVLSHKLPPKMALHSEFSGHGDEILDAVIQHWDTDLKEEVAKPTTEMHKVVDTEFQTQGDPLLKTYRDHLNIGESEARHKSTNGVE